MQAKYSKPANEDSLGLEMVDPKKHRLHPKQLHRNQLPKKIGRLFAFWYWWDQEKGVWVPRIVLASMASMLGQIPVLLIAVGTLSLHAHLLPLLDGVSLAWKLVDVMLVALTLWDFLNVLIGNPGVATEVLRHQQNQILRETQSTDLESEPSETEISRGGCEYLDSNEKETTGGDEEEVDSGHGNTCNHCDVAKSSFTTHCGLCGVCMDDRDHHCIFFGKCIAKQNLEHFKQAIGLFVISAVYFSVVIMLDTIWKE